MKVFCLHTPNYSASYAGAKRCYDSFVKKHGNDFEICLHKTVHIDNLKETILEHDIPMKYLPSNNPKTDFNKRLAPYTRICNGITHYLLYRKCVDENVPYCIFEHDVELISKIPNSIDNGIIQIGTNRRQLTSENIAKCSRAVKKKKYDSNFNEEDIRNSFREGVIRHPLRSTNGTSGYIIDPLAAKEFLNYLNLDGVGFADRIREEHFSTSKIYLQVPQSAMIVKELNSKPLLRKNTDKVRKIKYEIKRNI